MIAPKDAIEPHSTGPLPNSSRIYAPGEIHPDVRVPMREISLAPTRHPSGAIEPNDPVRVYDTSGPWGDPDFSGDVEQALPPLRAEWILRRGDVQQYDGRPVAPTDNGYLSEIHESRALDSTNGNGHHLTRFPDSARRKPLRASAGHPVTQLWYARQGVITPEMEFIAIRETQSLDSLRSRPSASQPRNTLSHQHPGSPSQSDS